MTNVDLTYDQRQSKRFNDLCAVDHTLRKIGPHPVAGRTPRGWSTPSPR
jgi:hypothetical protein